MPTNLGINEAHHMMGGGGGSLHHGLPSSNSMNNLQAMQVRLRLCVRVCERQRQLVTVLPACLPACLPALGAVLTVSPPPLSPSPPLPPLPRRLACRCLACRA
jgi:hypothetical protein